MRQLNVYPDVLADLVLKAGEPEEFEAYRLLLRWYEPQTRATTVTKLVELLSTQFAGDLLDCVTDFERRVAVWEGEAREQLSDLIEIGVVVNGLEKGNFRDHLLISTSGTKQWSKFIREIEAVELARLNSRPTPMDLSAVGHDQQPTGFESCSWCGMYGHMARDCWKKQPSSLRVAKVSSPGTPLSVFPHSAESRQRDTGFVFVLRSLWTRVTCQSRHP